MTTRVGRVQDRGGRFLILLFGFWIGPATVARADTTFYTGNLRTDATFTGCGSGCTSVSACQEMAWHKQARGNR